MKVDRYTRIVLTAIALALSALAFNYIIALQPAVAAAPAQDGGSYQLAVVGNAIDGIRTAVIDTRSGTLYHASPPYSVYTLDARTGYRR